MKYSVHAVIPVGQYANLQPSIEVEADSYEEAQAQVMPYIVQFWNQYGEKPLTAGVTIRKTDFFGNEIDWDEANHLYSWNGVKYESGSEYAGKRKKDFDAQQVSQVMGKKWGVAPEDIRAMWELKKRVSMGFGTALHGALELYGKYNGLAEKMEKATATHDHPILKKAVEDFYKDRKGEEAKYEVLVVDHASKRAGTIDRLLISGDKTCRIQDFKTNVKEDMEYWKDQLTFYAGVVEANGWKVEGKDVFQWDGGWKTHVIV